MSRAVRMRSDYPTPISTHRRALARTGQLRAVAHIGRNHEHLLELSTSGALGTVVLTRQNLVEALRAFEVFEALAERADDQDIMFPRAERLVF